MKILKKNKVTLMDVLVVSVITSILICLIFFASLNNTVQQITKKIDSLPQRVCHTERAYSGYFVCSMPSVTSNISYEYKAIKEVYYLEEGNISSIQINNAPTNCQRYYEEKEVCEVK